MEENDDNLENDEGDEVTDEEIQENFQEEIQEDFQDDEKDDSDDVKEIIGGRRRGKKPELFSLTFRDVEESIRTFDGKDEYPVRKWIQDFEEVAEIIGWNDLQKLIFGKKLLPGLAKLFVQSERGIKTWSELKKKLIAEFEESIRSAEIHKMLMNRRLKKDESVQEYVLHMREIGSRAYIEEEVIIQYIIDGIQDDTSNKIVLYGAKNFRQFKEKVQMYEKIRASMKRTITKEKVPVTRSHRDETAKGDARKVTHKPKNERAGCCYNCGDRGHISKNCPNKSKGLKCFSCNKFGHTSSMCTQRPSTSRAAEEPSTSTSIATIDVVPSSAVKLNINGVELIALFDTGSEITVIRNDVYENHFQGIKLTAEIINLRGIGTNRVSTLGTFTQIVHVNDEEMDMKTIFKALS
uniref:Uncharacterized protein LOC114336875 n=1 Tax=Diabrotica virgifera virgifera TaxID=50390 RepID=A0A6P7GGN0_DIAVI